MAGPDSSFEFFYYNPSLAAAVIFVFLFFGTTAYHCIQAITRLSWYFTPLIIGGLLECIGYAARSVSAHQSPHWSLIPFLIQTLFLLVSPALFAATIYMTLGRIILALDGEARSIIRKRWLTNIFVVGDVLSFFLQGSGGGILSKGTASAVKLGQIVILLGLFVQIIFFGLFIVVTYIFYRRMCANPTGKALSPEMPWKKYMYALFAVSALIVIRSLFRIIEYAQGNGGSIMRHEVLLYLFDSVLMFAVLVTLNVMHPSQIILRSFHVVVMDHNIERDIPLDTRDKEAHVAGSSNGSYQERAGVAAYYKMGVWT